MTNLGELGLSQFGKYDYVCISATSPTVELFTCCIMYPSVPADVTATFATSRMRLALLYGYL